MNKEQREIIKLLKESDFTHEELSNELNLKWYELQELLKPLILNKKIIRTTDRKYTINK